MEQLKHLMSDPADCNISQQALNKEIVRDYFHNKSIEVIDKDIK